MKVVHAAADYVQMQKTQVPLHVITALHLLHSRRSRSRSDSALLDPLLKTTNQRAQKPVF